MPHFFFSSYMRSPIDFGVSVLGVDLRDQFFKGKPSCSPPTLFPAMSSPLRFSHNNACFSH